MVIEEIGFHILILKFLRIKGRDIMTQSHDKSPYTNRKSKKK